MSASSKEMPWPLVSLPRSNSLGETTRSISRPATRLAMLACDGSLREPGPPPFRDPDRGTGMEGTLEGTGHAIMCGEARDEELMARVAAAGDTRRF